MSACPEKTRRVSVPALLRCEGLWSYTTTAMHDNEYVHTPPDLCDVDRKDKTVRLWVYHQLDNAFACT